MKTNIQLGIYEKAIHIDFDWNTKLQLAKAANFSFVELSIDESPERLARLEWTQEEWLKLKELCVQHNCFFHSLCLSAHRKYSLGSLNKQTRNHGMKILEQALQICQWMDIKIIQLAGYDVFYEFSNDQTKKLFLANLAIAAQKAADAQVVLGVETMDTSFMGTAERVSHFIKPIKSDFLKIYPDLGNLYQWSEDPLFDIENNMHNFVQIHFKATRPNIFRDLAWSDSNVPYQSLLGSLIDGGYHHNFVAETWANQKMTYEEQLHFLQETYDFVKQTLETAGYVVC